MLLPYFIIVTATSTASLTWRALKDDHPAFKAWVKNLPIAGEALTCGFCASLWFSLIAVLIANPLAGLSLSYSFNWYALQALVTLGVDWFSVGAGVLLLRSVIVVLLELGANLKHKHAARHRGVQ